MSTGENRMHSHSGLEKELEYPKRYVIVDKSFRDSFSAKDILEEFSLIREGRKIEYIKVPVLEFIKKGGIFKNLNF